MEAERLGEEDCSFFCVGRKYAAAAAVERKLQVCRPPSGRYSHHSFVSSVINITDGYARVGVSCITTSSKEKKKSGAGYKYGEIAAVIAARSMSRVPSSQQRGKCRTLLDQDGGLSDAGFSRRR